MARSVSPRRSDRSNTEMTTVGYLVAVPLFALLLPIAPVLLVLWLVDRL
ncbi:hypothetical protein HZS55_21190 [Halosimplex rubrum]|uniref:Uncharacterized protein n=1 Tax=Halosimplex rubrum TaxID=869889 RepID=A0A7D5TRC7_9EURY|nr:hypothetical protein [Halosimplex rubrum]QLH79654.1 hypothetical protein HZS55_21190 [Halosimplex rubrum]